MGHDRKWNPTNARTRGTTRRTISVACVVLILVGVTACDLLDSIIQISAPSRVQADDLTRPGNAALLVNSLATDFECAFGHYIVASGLVGNEWEVGTTLIAWKDYDRRVFQPVGSAYTDTSCDSDSNVGVYVPLSVARWQADNTLSLLDGWTDADVSDRTSLIATAAVYSGYSHVLMGEAMCSAAFDAGPEMSPQQVFERAEQRFTRAIEAAQATGDTEILSLARVGRARTRMNLAKKAEAAADAIAVSVGFVYNATYSADSPRRENPVVTRSDRLQLITVGPTYRNRTFQGVPDPRVPVRNTQGFAQDGTTTLWLQDKYATISSPIPMATWEEAQLILAEAELAAGNVQEAVDIINLLHERAGLPEFSSTDATEVMDQIVWERESELFLESHHLGDVSRYGIPLIPPPGAPFKDGGTYGDQLCFPLPDVERQNNPNIP